VDLLQQIVHATGAVIGVGIVVGGMGICAFAAWLVMDRNVDTMISLRIVFIKSSSMFT
jgi:hypothetical protein